MGASGACRGQAAAHTPGLLGVPFRAPAGRDPRGGIPLPVLRTRVPEPADRPRPHRTVPQGHATPGHGEGQRLPHTETPVPGLREQLSSSRSNRVVLDGHPRSDEPGLQGFRGRGWLPPTGVLEAALRGGGQVPVLGGGHGAVQGQHRPAGASGMGTLELPGGACGLPGDRRELVRSGRLCRVRGEAPPYRLPLGPRGRHREHGILSPPEQFFRAPRARRVLSRFSQSVGPPRHGRQRPGVVLQRHRGRALHPG